MREKNQTPAQPQFNYVPMIVPVPMPAISENKREDRNSDISVIGAFFWAIIILLSFWFITGGYNILQ